MFRKILIFLFLLVLVTAKRFGISMINDIQYGQWRWEKRNNKTMLPAGGINADGPYGRYRRPREIILDDNENGQQNQRKSQPKSLMKILRQQRSTKFDDFWSTDTEDFDFSNRSRGSGSMSSIHSRHVKRSESMSSLNSTQSNPDLREKSYSYSTPSYSTYSYSTRSHKYHGWYWKHNRGMNNEMNNSSSMNNIYGENRNNTTTKSYSNQNESFSMPNLAQ